MACSKQNGQAFTSTEESGSAAVAAVGTGGSGTLTVGRGGRIERRSVHAVHADDRGTAGIQPPNTKIIATVNTLLQDVLNMVQG